MKSAPILAQVLGGTASIQQQLYSMPTKASSRQEVWQLRKKKKVSRFSITSDNEAALIELREMKKEKELNRRIQDEIDNEEEVVVHEDAFFPTSSHETTDPFLLFSDFCLPIN